MGGPRPHRGTDTTQRWFGAGRTFPTALEQVPEADGGGAQQLVPQRVAAPHLQVQVALRRDVPEGGDTKTGAMAAAPCEGQQEGAGEERATATPPPQGLALTQQPSPWTPKQPGAVGVPTTPVPGSGGTPGPAAGAGRDLQDEDLVPEQLRAPHLLPRLLGLAGQPVPRHLHVAAQPRLPALGLGLHRHHCTRTAPGRVGTGQGAPPTAPAPRPCQGDSGGQQEAVLLLAAPCRARPCRCLPPAPNFPHPTAAPCPPSLPGCSHPRRWLRNPQG